MKSKIEWRSNVMIRAVLAAAFACALAFAFALCLPTTKAFAETSTAGNVGTVQDANENAEEAGAGKMAGGSEGDDVVSNPGNDGGKDDSEKDDIVAGPEKDGGKDNPENAGPAEVGETQQSGAQGPAEQPAQVGDSEDVSAPVGGDAQKATTEPLSPSPEGAVTRLVTNAVDGSPAKAEGGATPADGASDATNNVNTMEQAGDDTTWQNEFEYELGDADSANPTIKLKGFKGSGPSTTVKKKAIKDGKEYTTIIDTLTDHDEWTDDDGYHEHNEYKSAFSGGEGKLSSVTFESGVKILNATDLFKGFTSLATADIKNADFSNCASMERMFEGSGITSIDLMGVSAPKCESTRDMFKNCVKLSNANLSGVDLSGCKDINYIFSFDWYWVDPDPNIEDDEYSILPEGEVDRTVNLSNMNVASCKDMEGVFFNNTRLTSLDVSGWGTGSVTTMKDMFYSCSAITSLDVSKWNTGSVTDMESMFNGCKALETLDVSNWNTGNVTTMKNMFYSCSAITSLDVSKWNTGSVTDMESMFNGCSRLASLDVSDWDVSKVENFHTAFYGLPGTTVLDLRKWNASSVIEGERIIDEGEKVQSGWAEAFHGPLVLVSDGQMAKRVESGKNRADGRYIGIDYMGYYGIFLEDSMERVWCLNMGIEPPSDNLYTRYTEQLDAAGLQRLSTVFRAADTQMDKEERWEKIAAAITFFGNVLDADVQRTLQYAIWYYSDDLSVPEGVTPDPLDEDGQTKVKAMVDYVEANWQSLDYSELKINFYDSETNPTQKNANGTYVGKYQNLISLSTAETVKHKSAGKLVISKEIATGSDKNTTQVFTFTVKLKNADGTPYVMFVQVASEGEELRTVTPSQDGVITLTIIGEGEAIIANLRPGTTYEIMEEGVEGWTLVGKSGDKGTTAEGVTSEAKFANAEKGKEKKEELKAEEKEEAKVKNEEEAKDKKTTTKATTEVKEEAKTEKVATKAKAKKAATKAKAKTKKAATKAMAAKGVTAQTGDSAVVWPLIALALALASLATLIVARRKQSGR